MAFRKPIAVALSTVALAGFTALATGAATPAGAQTVAAPSKQAVTTWCDWRRRNCHHGGHHHGHHWGHHWGHHHGHHGHHWGHHHGHHHGGWGR